MKIELNQVPIRDLVEEYQDDGEGGVRGYGGKLDIRPPYQREFVYGDENRKAVIDTVSKGFPLNVMYWADCGDGMYEVIDGQQRTISIAQYVQGDFALPLFDIGEERGFHNLENDEQERILGYELHVYVCTGEESEKLKWFRIINIAGEPLTDQELRNSAYRGPWVSDAKKDFSGTNPRAKGVGKDYVKGRPLRQELLETAICWKIKQEEGLGLRKVKGEQIERYMAAHQQDPTATALWTHFQAVIDRVKAVFPEYRREMKGVDWGGLYARLEDELLDPEEIEANVSRLMLDDDVTSKPGIYPHLLTGDLKHLSIRAFTPAQKREAYERQDGLCAECGEDVAFGETEADHIDPWIEGGRTIPENCQVLCKPCNRRKSDR